MVPLGNNLKMNTMQTITIKRPLAKETLLELPVKSICSQSAYVTIFGGVGESTISKERLILAHKLGIVKSWETYSDGFRIRVSNEMIDYKG